MLVLCFDIDFDGLFEYLVVYIDCLFNYMFQVFQGVMCDFLVDLKVVYYVYVVVIILGFGILVMEVVVDQFVQGQYCLVICNGWFSYCWL